MADPATHVKVTDVIPVNLIEPLEQSIRVTQGSCLHHQMQRGTQAGIVSNGDGCGVAFTVDTEVQSVETATEVVGDCKSCCFPVANEMESLPAPPTIEDSSVIAPVKAMVSLPSPPSRAFQTFDGVAGHEIGHQLHQRPSAGVSRGHCEGDGVVASFTHQGITKSTCTEFNGVCVATINRWTMQLQYL